MFELVKFILQRSYLAMIVAGILGGLAHLMLPLSILSSAIVGFYILRKGERQGLLILLVTAVIIYMLSLIIKSKPGLEFPVAIILLLPVYISSVVLRSTQSQGFAIAATGICAVLMVIGIQLFSGDAVAWWAEWLEVAVKGVKGATVEGFEDNGTLQVINGLIAMILGIASLLSVLLARWLQSLIYNPGGFKEEFQLIRIPQKILYVLIVLSALFAVMQRNIMYDLAMIAMMIYFFQGLAIFHYTTNKKGYSSAYLLPPYILLFVMPQFAMVGLACVGLTDVFLNYRKLAKDANATK